MTRIVLIFGTIIGLVCIGMVILTVPTGESSTSLAHAELIGYSILIASLASIFFAVRQFRDLHQGGNIKFGKALQVGVLISLLATLFYVVGWEIYSSNFAPDFADHYIEQMKEEMAAKGMTEAEIDSQIASQQDMMDMYKENLPFRLFITSMEIFPVGLIISLIVALIFGVFLKPSDPTTTS